MAAPVVALTRRSVVAMKAEAAYGVDALGTVTPADVLWAFNIRPASRIEVIEMLAQAGVLGRMRSASGIEVFGLTFDIQIRGGGAAYSASVFDDLHLPLRAAGMLDTLDATPGSESYTYTPRSTGFESFTVKILQENGPTHVGLGCFANVALRGRAGEPGIATVTLAGILGIEEALALVTKPVTTLQPPALKAAQAQIDTVNYAFAPQNLALDLGIVLTRVDSANAVGAVEGFLITDRQPGGSFDPRIVPAATYDWFDTWRNKPAGVDLSWQWGATQYNRIKISMPEVTIGDRGWGERDGYGAFQIAYRAHPSIGDDEVTIVAD